ncbi:recombinase family protein, partial [Streptomyces sp. NPDC007095]|uniref:recombinase family protein n=1 Tax=Streptomyces sp. NPDC007095 TaxID=3154482 RepID=UPI0033ED98D9
MIRFVFAGRVSREDLQDPEASRAWQRHRSETLISPTGGVIVGEYFDVGQTRALPWQRRPRANELLEELKNPNRGFDAVVIGEPQRMFYGNQFSLIFPLFEHYRVPLWVPEVGGPVDPSSDAHDLLMSIYGGTSKAERNRIKIRVRAAMEALTAAEGRFLGGRPPYGYKLVDAGPHPNPARASDGKRLYRLELDPETAPVVTRIYREYLRGRGIHAIAEGLTRSGVPCPSRYDPNRNRHRNTAAWSKNTVRAILQNPRYTGHQVWNRHRKEEVLIDVDDVTLGHRSQLVLNSPDKWIYSMGQTHDPIVMPEVFDEVQRRMAIRRNAVVHERSPRATDRPYALRGLLRCGLCERKMQGSYHNGRPYYRCTYPGAYVKEKGLDHPVTINLREDHLLPSLDAWIAQVFDEARLDETLRAMLQTGQTGPRKDSEAEAARRTLAAIERRLAKYRAALDAGADPTVVAGWITEAQRERGLAEHRLTRRSMHAAHPLTDDELRDIVAELGNMKDRLLHAEPSRKEELYREFGLCMTYNVRTRTLSVESRPEPMSRVWLGANPRGVTTHIHAPAFRVELKIPIVERVRDPKGFF